MVNRAHRVAQAVARSPLLWGAIVGTAFYALVQQRILGREFFPRYCAGHPVNYTETYLFFVGLAVLALKAIDLASQRRGLGLVVFGPMPRGGQSPAEAEALLARLDRLPPPRHDDYLVRRLREGLQYVARHQSGEGLDEHLKHLADLDRDRAHASLGLLRLIVWAIPILGFLGTVIGITLAIASLKPNALEESMIEVTAGLGVAFDTTALALALSILLMFAQHYVDRAETALLAEVDERVEAELSGRFPAVGARQDHDAAAVRRAADAMISSLEQLVRRQADLWRSALDAAQERWTHMAGEAGRQLQAALAASLGDTLAAHARQQSEARRFEETVANLAAAIHLLNARLGDLPQGSGALGDRVRRTSQAA